MKSTITGFFDHKGKLSLEGQIDVAVKHDLDAICLRYYDHKPLLEISDKGIKDILQQTKDKKIKIAAIDTLIEAYDLNNDAKAANAFDEFKFVVKLADKLKVNHLFIRLPKFNDVIEEFENIKLRLEPWITHASKHGKKLILVPDNDYKANTYAYVIKKMKTNILSVAFDPVYFMMIHESTTTSYRILKKKISAFMCHDADFKLKPKLIGYGKADIINLFKKLIRDRFSGLLMMDNEFYHEIFEPEAKKEGFFKKIFSNKKKQEKQQIDDLSRRIFPNEETKNVTYDDILSNQIKVVNIVFKK
jgi:hypothetical protein